jgi:hypothetical protein
MKVISDPAQVSKKNNTNGSYTLVKKELTSQVYGSQGRSRLSRRHENIQGALRKDARKGNVYKLRFKKQQRLFPLFQVKGGDYATRKEVVSQRDDLFSCDARLMRRHYFSE